MKNSKTKWKGIKAIITMENVISTVPWTLSHDEKTITNPFETANVFNNYFASVADAAKKNINYSHKNFSENFLNALILYLSKQHIVRK